ncbi:MAG TPA: UDP-N-acetylmuramoyl-L-alanyl-D-glutamate--2,6-diaminopimelate ligase [Xanthobacteraceae bacterium]|nr:UDP-N-acetylmuramoyl-L-alanyl-D-glutamate--2,6-diaminopimelate ligase [Xanthobacteraceae bacterium]
MKLRDLLPDGAAYEARFGACEIAGVTADSRTVGPGSLFVAMSGTRRDGTEFIPQALAAGAVAIMAERKPAAALPDGVALVTVANARRALALAAARFYPRQPQIVAAVTGTSGKTSVTAFARQIWTRLGHTAASIGTIGLVSPKTQAYGSLTTPDPVAFHRMLDGLVQEGVTHLAIEASSHGLDQHRLDGVDIAVGAFTNITRDHLDYHGTHEAYLAAKRILFERLVRPGGAAVIDVDHEHADSMVQAAQQRGLALFTVGRAGSGLRLRDAAVEGFAQVLTIEHAGRTTRVRLPLVGEFQIENALVAAGIAITSGSDPDAVFAALEGLEGAKGRLELVGRKDGAPIFVDYAHKPDALAKALEALRPYVRDRLVVVFGAGGDRDAGKRPLMGAIAAEKADRVIVTDDNPRSEDPAAIRAAILAAAPGAIEIGDRGAAIRQAVQELRAGDVLLIAGKGHESGQIVGERVLPFTDHEAVLAALGGKAG